MSPLKQFMDAANAILTGAEQSRLPQDRPPAFLATTWIFAEVDEALAACVSLSHRIKIARLNEDHEAAKRLTAELARTSFQINAMCRTAAEVFAREPKP